MTVSPAMRRYAAEIYRLQQDHDQVSLSLLSSHIESSAQAISTMVKRLNENGFLVHEPYRGVRLTSAGEKIAMRIIKIDKLTTAEGTNDHVPRAYRFGYGYVDENFNFRVDNGEKKIYFEISDYSTNYIFYENYKG